MIAIVLLLSVSVNGFSSLSTNLYETEETTSNWRECPSNIGPLTKCASNSLLDCYCLVSKQMIRGDAVNYCYSKQMQLLSIESQVENDFVLNLVAGSKDLIRNQFWIAGYNANLDTDNWVWQFPNSSITKPLTYQNWCLGEPNNYEKVEHFMAVINKCWHDVPAYMNWPSVCKREANLFVTSFHQQFFYTFPGERNAVVPCRPATDGDELRVDISKEINKQNTSFYDQIIRNGTSNNEEYVYDPFKGFIIRNVSMKDNGTYKCSTFVGMKEVWQLFHVIVTGVQLLVDPRSDPLEGSNVTLKCDSQKLKRRDPPFDPVEWSVIFANSVNGIETSLKSSNSVILPTGVQIQFSVETENDVPLLKISNVSIAMSGTYVCRSMFHGSENSVQLSSNSFSINILKKVDWSDKISRQELKGILTPASTNADNYRVISVGSDLFISCTFGTSGYLHYYQWQWEQFDDNPQYTSERNEAILSRLIETRTTNSGDGRDNFTLLLTNVRLSDRGLFTCLFVGSPSMNISQYIYVDDQHQSADIKFDLIKSSWKNTYNRTLGQTSVIPCRPNHPSIGIYISKLSKDVEQTTAFLGETHNVIRFRQRFYTPGKTGCLPYKGCLNQIVFNGTSSDDNYDYNPQKGFIIQRVLPEHDWRLTAFRCAATASRGMFKEVIFFIAVTGVYIECSTGCTSTQGINGLLISQVNPIAGQREEKIELHCNAYLNNAKPAVIEWFFMSNGVEVKISDSKAQNGMKSILTLKKNHEPSRKLTIFNVTKNSFGTYRCFVQADAGNFSESINIQEDILMNIDQTAVIVSVTIVVVLLLLIVTVIFFVCFHKNGRRKFTKLEHLLQGETTQINPNEPLDEQTDLLPYDARWEFPRNRLRLGKQLGVGCFARVVQAQAIGINDGTENSVSTVAVKMIRSRTNVAAFEGLISELKILIHLGAHVNILNLLGACTKGIHRGELLVIVEYCPFGNLRTFIINHRDTFVSQIDKGGELIESDVENDADDIVTTRKLICWSFQIARGMDYLITKKVLHGDLAARNILLSEHNVVKVADFGLSRQLYKDENYMKNSKGLLPLKWMAIESLTDRIWSSRSDVWSYGIVLWEIFSLGQMPYQGYTDEFQFLQALKNGYRMEKPEHTPKCVAEVMEGCWKADPNQRPTFGQIEEALDAPLESFVTSFYLQLNEKCQQSNIDKMAFENFSLKPDNPSDAEGRKSTHLASRRRSSTTNYYVKNVSCGPKNSALKSFHQCGVNKEGVQNETTGF